MLRRTLLPLLGLLLLTARPGATWSIVCVNRATREVGVASATCLVNFNLRTGVPVIYVGEGAAAAQSLLDFTGVNRRLIFNSFRDTEETPAEILARLAAQDGSHRSKQYGIVNFAGDPLTFTGNLAGAAATGVTGEIGDILYAIQGNVLTGDAVVFAAEAAFRTTKGDMGQKMMAAMEGARALGGDGRCSCSNGAPTSCGAPPPSFNKSAHVGVVIVARVGDANGGCAAGQGCAQGTYYLNLNVIGNGAAPDPVFTLQRRYDEWRLRQKGRPDGIRSILRSKVLPADGETTGEFVLELRDVDDIPLGHGGAFVEVEPLDPASTTGIGPVTDLGDGRYTFMLKAGLQEGTELFNVRMTDVGGDPPDIRSATLYPHLEFRTSDTALHAGTDTLSASSGGTVPFVAYVRARPLAPYLLVARVRPPQLRGFGGPAPDAGGPVLALGERPFHPAGPLLLDARGRAEITLEVPPGALVPLLGRAIVVTGYVLGGAPLVTTNPVRIQVLP